MSTRCWTRIRRPVPEQQHARVLIDTSVVIDAERLASGTLPRELTISAVTLAELAAGPHATDDPAERARRQENVQRAEAMLEPLAFDAAAARAYARVYAAVAASGRKARGRRALDLLIAATAVAAGLPLYTRNVEDFAGLEELLEVVPVGLAPSA
jgi:predicted nucleic acid-binding protein